ncbi:hypothetical protein KDL01_04405 [Actinospica durhamensis]|uniref:Uncharacterized protein n=1 Tax=Actinospica durhamensis TaxID=1508375 RepID=A0A941IL15_9ACTN|nr:hypothetical protein [Actinospica durhamensis]MBR7832485.1 hypothetical protein [Actinospica durhamensis]
MLAPDIADAAQYGINARLLNEAHDLDRPALDQWLDTLPDDRYGAGLRCHAHLLAARNTATETTAVH